MSVKTLLDRIHHIVYGPAGQKVIIGLIIINALSLGLETSPTATALAGVPLSWCSRICLWLFVIEMVLKIVSAPRAFIHSGWHLFDLFLIALSVISFPSQLSVLRSLRLARLLRIISQVPKLRVVVESIVKSLPSLAWLSLLVIVFVYNFAVLSTTVFGQDFPEFFGSLPASLYTLFQILTMESWSSGIARPVMAEYPHAYLFFVPFVFFGTFILFNSFCAIIVNYLREASVRRNKLRFKRKRRKPWRMTR